MQGSQVCHCEEAEGRRGALSAKREEVPLGCNLGKALPIYTECRRTQSLSNLTVAALTAQPLAALPPYGCGVPFTGGERLRQLQILQR